MAEVSVIIPLYNKRGKFRATIQSVLNQTFADLEVIIIDDGSTDDSLSAIHDIADSRITIYQQPNSGVSRARNLGIDKARGRYIVFLDADDEWYPDFLSSLLKLAAEYPNCDIFASDYKFRNDKGQEYSTTIRRLGIEGNCGIIDNYFKAASNSHPPLCSGSAMVRRSVLSDRAYYFNENVHHGEDLIFWAKLAATYKIAYTKDVLMTYNIRLASPIKCSDNIENIQDSLYGTLLEINADSHPKYLSAYIAQCKKMSVSSLTRRGQYRRAIKEAILGLRYNPLKWEMYVYILINILRIPRVLDAISRIRYLLRSRRLHAPT